MQRSGHRGAPAPAATYCEERQPLALVCVSAPAEGDLNDMPHLTEALKRSVPEMEQANCVLLESLRAQGKG